MEGLTVLSNIAIILLLGLMSTILSKKLKISNVLLLVLTGVGLQYIRLDGEQLFNFSPSFLVSVSTLAIVLIVFDSTSRFQWKDMDELSTESLEVTGVYTLFMLIGLSLLAMFIMYDSFTLAHYLYAMIFSSVMIATDPTSLFAMMGDADDRIIEFLEIESLINTPLTVLLPYIVLDFIEAEGSVLSSFVAQILPFLRQLVVGVGAGVLIGVIVFRAMKTVYSEQLSPVGLITAALLAYTLADAMEGSGVLAVATLGLFFGSVYVKQKATLQEFSTMLSNSLEILVFVLIGLIITLPTQSAFYLESLALFIGLLLCRGAAIFFTIPQYSFGEKLFATLNAPKGIAMAVVVFSLTLVEQQQVTAMLDYMLVIMLYSLALSTLVTRVSHWFLDKKHVQPK